MVVTRGYVSLPLPHVRACVAAKDKRHTTRASYLRPADRIERAESLDDMCSKAVGAVFGGGADCCRTVLFVSDNSYALAPAGLHFAAHAVHEADAPHLWQMSVHARLRALLSALTASLLPTAALAKLKPGTHLLNFSRAELVDGEALAAAMNEGVGGPNPH